MPELALMVRRPATGKASSRRPSARAGDGDLLLDALRSNSEVMQGLSETLGGVKADVAALCVRVGFIDERLKEVVEPALWKMEAERQQKIGAKHLVEKIGGLITAGRLALVGAASAVTYALTHWPPWLTGGKAP